MFIETLDIVPPLLVTAKVVTIGVCILFLISGLDDIFIDVYFVVRWLYRRLWHGTATVALSEVELDKVIEKPIAVMVPAWDEAAVIRRMLKHSINAVKYKNVHYFVGTYPNDPDTQREVDMVVNEISNVHRVTNRSNGPTSKADCLNAIYRWILAYEQDRNVTFQLFVIDDCEDVIHPLCFKLFNYLTPAYDMVQLPVHSLRRKWYEFTGGHYIDEFAQLHVKDLVVRDAFSGIIPTAGVGVAFGRRALDVLTQGNQIELFATNSLTEDYDIGFRLGEAGLKQLFARVNVDTEDNHSGIRQSGAVDRELICVKEYFPNRFGAAVRQKSRWVMGIALQGWSSIGWVGTWQTRYMLLRDRKVLITNLVNVLGYAVAAVVLAVWLTLWINPESYRYPPLLERGSVLWYVVLINALFLFVRIGARALCVYVLYGWREALLSVPRMFWGNVINFVATCRAIRIYLGYLLTGKIIVWDKTSHLYPSEEELPDVAGYLHKSSSNAK